jgi:hypothetical protein
VAEPVAGVEKGTSPRPRRCCREMGFRVASPLQDFGLRGDRGLLSDVQGFNSVGVFTSVTRSIADPPQNPPQSFAAGWAEGVMRRAIRRGTLPRGCEH